MMDPFRLCVALGPLALYFLAVGLMNFSRRPRVVSGTRDTAALGFATAGLLLVGPIELLLPALPVRITAYVWLLLLVLYVLIVSLVVLLLAPRIVVYNVNYEQIRPALAETVNQLDPDARWAGGSVSLPRLHVEFFLDDYPFIRNVSLVSTGAPQSYAGWRLLERTLRSQLRESVETRPNAWGVGVLVTALAILGRMGWLIYSHPDQITQGFVEMMRL